MSRTGAADVAWRLGWWAPLPPPLDPAAIVDPSMHGPLLAAAAAGSPLDPVGRGRLDGLKAAGLVDANLRPRFPVVTCEGVAPVRAAAGGLGAGVARLLAGEWSRIEVEHEPVRGVVPGRTEPAAAFLVVGGLLLELGVRRLLRRQGLVAPPLGAPFVWLAEGGEGAAGLWAARSTQLPGRGWLIRFGRPDSSAWQAAAVEPEAAPALPAGREPALADLVDALGAPVARLVAESLPALERTRPRPAGEVPGAFLAWAYGLAVDAALAALARRGLVEFPPEGAVAVRVAEPVLAAA
jgi:hypothetical protein